VADSDDISGELGPAGDEPEARGPSHLRAASGAIFVAVLPWFVAGYLLFSWAGQSLFSLLNTYALPLGAAALALGAFSLWQVVIAVRHLLAWAMAKRRA
jgi:hypothetical protein